WFPARLRMSDFDHFRQHQTKEDGIAATQPGQVIDGAGWRPQQFAKKPLLTVAGNHPPRSVKLAPQEAPEPSERYGVPLAPKTQSGADFTAMANNVLSQVQEGIRANHLHLPRTLPSQEG